MRCQYWLAIFWILPERGRAGIAHRSRCTFFCLSILILATFPAEQAFILLPPISPVAKFRSGLFSFHSFFLWQFFEYLSIQYKSSVCQEDFGEIRMFLSWSSIYISKLWFQPALSFDLRRSDDDVSKKSTMNPLCQLAPLSPKL